MIYELRVYTAMPGRLPDVSLAGFRDHAVGIWNRLGIRQLGYWTTAVGPNSNALTYMLVWESLADRELKWGKFVVDPEWVGVRNASEAADCCEDGQLVPGADLFLACELRPAHACGAHASFHQVDAVSMIANRARHPSK